MSLCKLLYDLLNEVSELSKLRGRLDNFRNEFEDMTDDEAFELSLRINNLNASMIQILKDYHTEGSYSNSDFERIEGMICDVKIDWSDFLD